MYSNIYPLAVSGGDLSWGESLALMLVGFLLVIFILAVLSAVTSLLGQFFRTAAPPPERPHAVPLLEKDSEREAAGGIEPAVVAAIGAALAVLMANRPYRISRIQRLPGGWAQEGRRQIFSSHRVR